MAARRSILSAILIIAAATALAAPAANAGLIFTAPASYCDKTPVRPFLPWGDGTFYVLTPGGSFESGTPAWSLAGSARVVSGNEPFHVHSSSDSRSLSLPAGSSATTPTMCFASGDMQLRLFAVSAGSTPGLKVQIVVRNLLGGLLSVLDGGTVSPSGSWQPVKPLGLMFTNLGNLLGTTTAISLRFTPMGSGSWQIDDVYLDPYKIT